MYKKKICSLKACAILLALITFTFCFSSCSKSSDIVDDEVVTLDISGITVDGIPLTLMASVGEESRTYSLVAVFSDLPVVYVNISGPVLNKTGWVKKSTMQIVNAGDSDAVYAPSIRGRGNSTWAYFSALEWTPQGRFVDLVYNHEMMGTYYLCEQIKVDKNRVNINELKAGDVDESSVIGGYLLEFDEYFDEVYKFKTWKLSLPVNLKSPDEDVPDAQFSYIQNYVNNIEKRLASKAPYSEVESLIDIDSYTDWWLAYALIACDEPNHPKSAYMYKKRDGKLYAGPLWDFDLGTFKAPARWLTRYSLWYKYQESKSRLKERWAEHKAPLAEVTDYIDSVAQAIRESSVYDCSLWPLNGSSDVNGDESMSFDESIDLLKRIT